MISHSQFQHCSLLSREMSALQTQNLTCVVCRLVAPLAQTTPVPVHAPLFPYSRPKDKCFAKLCWSCVGLNVMEQIHFCCTGTVTGRGQEDCFCTSLLLQMAHPWNGLHDKVLKSRKPDGGREAICFSNAKVERTDLTIFCRCPQKGNVSLGGTV